jgi:hypothetical protein
VAVPTPKRSRRCRNADPNAALAMRLAPPDTKRPARHTQPLREKLSRIHLDIFAKFLEGRT